MNTIQTSLTTALRVKPIGELVWHELNAHPKSTGKQIAGRLNLSEKRVAASLHELSLRGMVKNRRDAPRRLTDGSMRSVKEWWCVFTTYERLPLVRKPSKNAKVQEYHAKHPLVPAVAPTTVMPAPVPVAAPDPTPASPLKGAYKPAELAAWLDRQELTSCLFMYKHLHAIFNYDRVA